MSKTNTPRIVRQALEAARHELTTLHGLMATDRPDLWDQDLAWDIDTRKTLALLNAALNALAGSDSGA